jgi:hypothetical protein
MNRRTRKAPLARRALRGLALSAALGVAAAALAVVLLAARYDEPVAVVAHKLARFAALTAIRVRVAVHDPSGPVVAAETGFPPPSWREAEAERERFLDRHPGIALEGVFEPAPGNPRVPFRFGAFRPADAERVRDFFHLDRFVADVWARYERLPPDDPWRRAFGTGHPDLYLLYALNNLVNGLWAHTDVPKQVWVVNFDVVQAARRGREGEKFYCHVYAMALLQLAQTLGYHGRLLTLSADGVRPSHAVTELWVNDLGRWVVFDPDFNLFYGGPKDPLNALEVRGRYLAGRDPGAWPGRDPATVSYDARKEAVGAAYRNLEWHFRDDYWVNKYFRGHPNRSDPNTVLWDDPLRSRVLMLEPKADRVEGVYFPLFGWTLVPLAYDPQGRTLRARLFVWYPGYAGFSVAPEGGAALAATRDGAGAVVTLPLPGRENVFELEVRSHAEARVQRRFTVRIVPAQDPGA